LSTPGAPERPDITQEYRNLKAFMLRVGCNESHTTILQQNEIDLLNIVQFDEQDFVKMGLPYGPARMLANALKRYQ
jgi:hypothetical protein